MKGKLAACMSRASDEWSTPQDLFDRLDGEFCFELDAAATLENAKVVPFIDPERDALKLDWRRKCFALPAVVWLNPPYSKCRAFIAKAAAEARNGCTVVCLLPARTDTRFFHDFIWDRELHQPRPGVEVRFLKGRLKFGGAANGAPFPSMLVIFRPVQ